MLNQIFITIYFIGLVIGSIVRVVYTKAYQRDHLQDDRKSFIDTLFIVIPGFGMMVLPVIYAVTSWLDFSDYRLLEHWQFSMGALGTLVFGGALWLLWRSHVDLGQNWTPTLQIRAGHQFVTSGIYRYIRHPMYAAHWVWGLAQALLLQNWIVGFSMLFTCFPCYLYRVSREEQMMLEHFGAPYQNYMNQTGRIFPRRYNAD